MSPLKKGTFGVAVFVALVSMFQPVDGHCFGRSTKKKKPKITVVNPSLPTAPLEHLNYFGYYASAMEGVGMDASRGNYTSQVRDHANFTWILGGEIEKLQEAETLGMKAIVDVSRYFFDGRSWNLLPDYKERWQRFAAQVKPYEATVLAFYPLDEPYHNGKKKGVSLPEMRRRLEVVAAEVKADFPDKPIAVIFTSKSMYRKNFALPAGFSWFGFDCYGSWWECATIDDKKKSIPEMYARLKRYMSAGQRSFVIPDGNFEEDGFPSKRERKDISSRAQKYYDLCRNDRDCVALIPFIFQSFSEKGDGKVSYYGVKDMPGVYETYQRIGKEIIQH